MQILNTVRNELNVDYPDGGSPEELLSIEIQALRKSVMIVANALDLEVNLRLDPRGSKRMERARVERQRLLARSSISAQGASASNRRSDVQRWRDKQRIALATEVIDSACNLLQDVMDPGSTAALRDALDTEFGVSRDA